MWALIEEYASGILWRLAKGWLSFTCIEGPFRMYGIKDPESLRNSGRLIAELLLLANLEDCENFFPFSRH